MTDENNADFSLAYLDSCDRLPLLLIHGFPLSSSMWELQIEDLGDMARVIAPDLRGHGRSGATPPPYSMATFAEDCADLLDYLAVPDPVVIGGLSMGGYVAFEFFRRFPERVAGLVLAATRATPDSKEGKANRDKMVKVVEEEGVTAVAAAMLPRLFSAQTYAEQPDVVEFVQEMMENTSLPGAIGALQAMRDRPDSSPTLAEIDVPTLIIHGLEDAIVPLAEAEAMQTAIPDAQLVKIANAGHLPNLEQPAAFSDAVADFIETLLSG